VKRLILARHGESVFSAELLVNGDIAVPGPLTSRGEEEARVLARALTDDEIDLCAISRFERTRQTADITLAGRDIPRLVVSELDDPRYGSFEGGSLDDYRAWARTVASDVVAPGEGESRRAIVDRYTRGFRTLSARAERTVLAVIHSLPIAYLLEARDGAPPERVVRLVEHAHPYRFEAAEVERALHVMEAWLAAPTW
jgi:alpha-ribazole phosphatase